MSGRRILGPFHEQTAVSYHAQNKVEWSVEDNGYVRGLSLLDSSSLLLSWCFSVFPALTRPLAPSQVTMAGMAADLGLGVEDLDFADLALYQGSEFPIKMVFDGAAPSSLPALAVSQ